MPHQQSRPGCRVPLRSRYLEGASEAVVGILSPFCDRTNLGSAGRQSMACRHCPQTTVLASSLHASHGRGTGTASGAQPSRNCHRVPRRTLHEQRAASNGSSLDLVELSPSYGSLACSARHWLKARCPPRPSSGQARPSLQRRPANRCSAQLTPASLGRHRRRTLRLWPPIRRVRREHLTIAAPMPAIRFTVHRLPADWPR